MTSTATYIVYKHECKLCKSTNGIYIGITRYDGKSRWKNGLGYLSKSPNGKYHQPAMANAILTYGWENFTHEFLFKNLTEQEAKIKEQELILYYNSYKQGLNCTLGGEGRLHYLTKEEAKVAKKDSAKRYQEKVYANPDLHAKAKEAQRLAHEKRKQDSEKHAKDLQSCRISNAHRRADEKIRQQINESARKTYQKKRADETELLKMREYHKNYRKQWLKLDENKNKSNEKAKAARQKVINCRNQLKAIYAISPELFTEEDIHTIFDRHLKSSNYKCMTFTTLNNILIRVQGGQN